MAWSQLKHIGPECGKLKRSLFLASFPGLHAPAFVACSTKSGGRPGRIYHVIRAAADVMYCS